MLLFMGLFNLKSSFYIATFAEQMKCMIFAPTAALLAATFNFAFPVGGFCTSAIASIVLDRLGEREDLYLTLVGSRRPVERRSLATANRTPPDLSRKKITLHV